MHGYLEYLCRGGGRGGEGEASLYKQTFPRKTFIS